VGVVVRPISVVDWKNWEVGAAAAAVVVGRHHHHRLPQDIPVVVVVVVVVHPVDHHHHPSSLSSSRGYVPRNYHRPRNPRPVATTAVAAIAVAI